VATRLVTDLCVVWTTAVGLAAGRLQLAVADCCYDSLIAAAAAADLSLLLLLAIRDVASFHANQQTQPQSLRTVSPLKLIHTAAPDATKLSCLCRVRFADVNWALAYITGLRSLLACACQQHLLIPRTVLYPSEIIVLIQHPVTVHSSVVDIGRYFFNLFYMSTWYCVTVPTLEFDYLHILH